MADPTTQPGKPSSARVLQVLVWASEIALAVAVVYVLANRPAKAPAPVPTPAATASPSRPG